MLPMELPDKRFGDRPKQGYMDSVNDNIKIMGMTVADLSHIASYSKAIFSGHLLFGKSERRKRRKLITIIYK